MAGEFNCIYDCGLELENGRLKQNIASFTQAAFKQKERADAAEVLVDGWMQRAVAAEKLNDSLSHQLRILKESRDEETT